MSVIPVEKTFPRGGFQESSPHPRPRATNSRSLFQVKKPRHIPRPVIDGKQPNTDHTSSKKAPKEDTEFFRLKKYTGQLSYKSISEGMPTLAVIFAITELEMKVALPGNNVATVPITNISETYTNALRNAVMHNSGEKIAPLREMFKIGQYVVAKVVGKVCENNRNKITVTLDPQSLYSDIPLADTVEGMVVMATVKSIEEKIYLMDLGNKITRAFLSFENAKTYVRTWNEGKQLGVGQVVRCLVKNVKTVDSMMTLVLTADPVKVAKASCDDTGATLETLMPGMKFSAIVSRLYSTGIQIQLSDNFVGYVHKDHFETPFKSPDNYEIGVSVKAQVLYILPSGAIYFTLKPSILVESLPVDPYSIIKCGEIISEAEVFGTSEAGLVIKVGKHCDTSLKGFVPLNQTSYRPQDDNDEFDTPIAQQLSIQFPPFSDVKCRVMDYNYMEQFYICTMDPDLIKEKIINPALLEVGMVVLCIIQEILPKKGIVLTIGKGCRTTGFVPTSHMADVQLSNPLKKYNVGQTCLARVLSLKEGKYIFTMKRLLVESKDPILSSFEDAKIGDQYTGTVQQTNEKGVMVQFFNLVHGWLPAAANKRYKLYFGQLVLCKITNKFEALQELELTTKNLDLPNTNSTVNGTPKGGEKKLKKSQVNSTEQTESSLISPILTSEERKPELNSIQKYQMARKLKAEADKAPKDGKQTNGDLEEKSPFDLPKRTARKIKKEAAKAAREEGEINGDQVVEPPQLSNRAAKKLAREAARLAREEKERNGGQGALDLPQKLDKNSLNEGKVSKNSSESLTETQSSNKMKKSDITHARAELNSKQATAEAMSGKENKSKQNKETSTAGTSELQSPLLQNKEAPTLSKKEAKKRKNSESQAEGENKKKLEENSHETTAPKKNEEISAAGKQSKLMCLLTLKKETAPSVPNGDNKKGKNGKSEIELETKKCKKQLTVPATPPMSKEATKKRKNAKPEVEVETKKQKMKLTATPALPKMVVALPRLTVSTGFVWDANPNLLPVVAGIQDESESSEEETEDKSKKVKKTRRVILEEKRVQAQQEEARLRKIEQRLMDADAPPQSADEFDRLVLSSPDSSMVWLQYMAHHLQATEIEKARSVAKRAIKTISFREEQERQNVWVALLNLENLYGTRESLETTLEEAVKFCDAYQIYTQMLQIYGESHKLDDGERLIGVISKKYKQNKDTWFNAAIFYMKSSQMEKARGLMKRALVCVDKKEHVAVISRFAVLENKYGSQERAQTLMEQILVSYPKRIDVWSAYVDMLVKSNLVDLARKVLERGVSQRLPSHKMKTLFKKFLAFEETHGTERDMEKVRELAYNYVESASSSFH